MQLPIRHITGNLIFTTYGAVFGVWRVTSANYSHSPYVARTRRLKALETLIKTLQGEPMMLSLCPQIDPVAVVRAMTADIDISANTEASARMEELSHRVLDQLEEVELTGRTDWLVVPLPAVSRLAQAREVAAAARAQVESALGLLPAPVTTAEETARLEQAQRMAAQWPSAIETRPASEAEILWIYAHSARRGLLEPLLPDPAAEPAAGGDEGGIPSRTRGRGRQVAALSQVVLAEGGLPTNQGDGGRALDNPFQRRFVQVATEWGDSYQVLLALGEMPERFRFPGSEYLQQLDDFPFPVDWAARLKIVPGQKAEAKTRKRRRAVKGQANEYRDDPAGPPADVATAEEGLDDYSQRITASRQEVAVQAMVTLAVWGPTAEVAEDRAGALSSHFGGGDYTFNRPLGEQASLFTAMLPGCRTPMVLRDYAQSLLARDFAMAMPWCGSNLGDDTGHLYAQQLAAGGVRPVLVDFSYGPRNDTSASAGFIGELGVGKSFAKKSAVNSVLLRGRRLGYAASRGRAVIVDRTRDQEWVRFARACPGSTEVITVDRHAQVSLDPLRIFDADEAARFTESFLTLLLGVKPMDLEGVALSEAVAAVLARPGPSMTGLVDELAERGRGGDTASQNLARKLSAVSRKDLARVVFDPTLPAVQTPDADSVVFSVADLMLPKKAELASEHRIERLEFEKVLGRAVMYLIGALCRQVAYASKEEFVVCVWDECWWLTNSEEGLELVLEVVRDGRKNNAAAFLGSHDPEDFGPSNSERGLIIRGLIRHRLVFRQSDSKLAKRALAFLELDPDDPKLVELVTSQLSPLDVSDEEKAARRGECLYRDLRGRIGTMQVLMPADPKIAANIHSTPMRTEAAA
ncbi:ATP/GTP-binding protein [Streptomyces sp. A7024]|uniref:ATP/GTP-binding protein n=1 Tax=Streptomyces coryli TaxID=1128680 RepID=A0A6G4TVP6_9ACTN|nr:ATP-binding protein [Streptomyces coryli]NGN63188.1 ATP/GTP-binding protein [Streptomyces coryli]